MKNVKLIKDSKFYSTEELEFANKIIIIIFDGLYIIKDINIGDKKNNTHFITIIKKKNINIFQQF